MTLKIGKVYPYALALAAATYILARVTQSII